MENLSLSQKKNSFSLFASALACVVFIILNLLFVELFSLVPASTISGNLVIPSVITNDGITYNVKSIGDEAFYASKNVENITINDGIEKIGTNAFAGTNISTIFIPSSVKTISAEYYDSSPFYACKSSLVIYLEADEVPESFGEYWNYRTYEQPFVVKTGYSRETYLSEINMTEQDLVSTDNEQVGYTFYSDGTAVVVRGKEGFSRLNKAVYYVASFLIEAVFALAAYIVAVSVKTNIWVAAGMNKKINGKLILYGAIISITCLVFFTGLTECFMDFLYLLGYTPRSVSIDIPNFGIYLVYVLISCIAPAICEELLFRGVILSGLKEKGEFFAIIVSAVIFSLMHGSPDQTVHQFIIGLVLGYIFIRTGNLWLGIIIHFFNNFIAITEVYFVQMLFSSSEVEEVVSEITETAETTTSSSAVVLSLILSLIFSVIMAVIGYRLVRYLANKMIDENNNLNDNNSKDNLVGKTELQTTINVNGIPTETEMLISGDGATEVTKSIEEEARRDFENDELFAEIQQRREPKEEEKQKPSLLVRIMFVGSIGYLVVQWILAFINGL